MSTFNDIESMNKTIRTYRDIIKSTVKRSDVQTRLITLLEVLKRHSCKQIGVSYMSKNTIADKLELSYKTVQRLMKKLEDLGMIRQVPMKRKSDMLQTANIVQIIPIFDDVYDKTPPKKSEKCPTNKTTTTTLKQKIKKQRNTHDDSKLSAEFVSSRVPKPFASFLSNFYHDAQTIEELYRVSQQVTRYLTYYSEQDKLQVSLEAFKQMIRNIKLGKKVKNLFGYYNRVLHGILDQRYFDELFEV
nr:helix-turn-helix domain-containing protein [Heyndrickxia oleronia]